MEPAAEHPYVRPERRGSDGCASGRKDERQDSGDWPADWAEIEGRVTGASANGEAGRQRSATSLTVECQRLPSGLGPAFGTEGRRLAGLPEPGGQPGAASRRSTAGPERLGRRRAARAGRSRRPRSSRRGRRRRWRRRAAEAPRRHEHAAGRHGTVRQHHDVGGAEIGGQRGSGRKRRSRMARSSRPSAPKPPLVRRRTARSACRRRRAGRTGGARPRLERGDQIRQALVRLDQAGEQDELGVRGQAEPATGLVARQRRPGFEHRAHAARP